MEQQNQTRIRVGGMTCANCEIVVERALAGIPNVAGTLVDHSKGEAVLYHAGEIDLGTVDQALMAAGYRLDSSNASRPYPKAADTGAALLVVLAILLIGRHFDLWRGVSVTEQMSLGFVFAIGLLASVSSCMAVTGGLLVAVAAKFNDAMPERSPLQRLWPHLFFNVGRIIAYTVFGALIGMVGATLTLSSTVSGIVTLAASVIMIVIGLQMLGVLPRFAFRVLRLPKAMLYGIHTLSTKATNVSALLLGGATFFLPCGFTIALQLYVLGKADALTGAITMLVFALGTLPALLGISLIASFSRGVVQMRLLTFAGVLVLVLGLANISFGVVQLQTGATVVPTNNMVTVEQPMGQSQIVNMTVRGLDYLPNRFTVRAGVLVEWRIDAKDAEGCGRILVSRSLRLQKFLSDTQTTVITFTPMQPGEYAFNCSMGMMTPNSGFTVTN